MSPIEVKCLQCGKSFKVRAEFAGKKGKCAVCGKVITIPNPNSPSGAAMDVSRDEADGERKNVAKQMAMGPAGFMRKPKRGFFARLFGKK
jgi:uncharacterized Zn finger protein